MMARPKPKASETDAGKLTKTENHDDGESGGSDSEIEEPNMVQNVKIEPTSAAPPSAEESDEEKHNDEHDENTTADTGADGEGQSADDSVIEQPANHPKVNLASGSGSEEQSEEEQRQSRKKPLSKMASGGKVGRAVRTTAKNQKPVAAKSQSESDNAESESYDEEEEPALNSHNAKPPSKPLPPKRTRTARGKPPTGKQQKAPAIGSQSESDEEEGEKKEQKAPPKSIVRSAKPPPQQMRAVRGKRVAKKRTAKAPPANSERSDIESEDEEDEQPAPAPKTANKTGRGARAAPSKAAAKAPKSGKTVSKRALAPPAQLVKEKRSKTDAKNAATSHTRPPRNKARNTDETIAAKKAAPLKTTVSASKGASKKEATTIKKKKNETTVVAAKTKTAKKPKSNATMKNDTMTSSASARAKLAARKNKRLSKVSSIITTYELKKDRAFEKMTLAEKIFVAIHALNERNGSTAASIIKYITDQTGVDKQRIGKQLRMYLKNYYEEGALVQKKNTKYSIHRKFQLKSKKYRHMVIANNNDGEGDIESFDDGEDVNE